jgi:hypothetical protein
MPWADVLYACDAWWWEYYGGCPGFHGEKWSTHDQNANPKLEIAAKYGVSLVRGQCGDGFSTDPSIIHYGSNSGFQAINLAMLFGARRILLVGFDMSSPNGKTHFFGHHPSFRGQPRYESFVGAYNDAAKRLQTGVEIINCTPGSALRCFPKADLIEAMDA